MIFKHDLLKFIRVPPNTVSIEEEPSLPSQRGRYDMPYFVDFHGIVIQAHVRSLSTLY